MSDPESGVRPSEAGVAGAGQRPGQQKSRRGKRKRRRSGAPAIPPAQTGPGAQPGAGAPQTSQAKAPDKKRKRRRRGKRPENALSAEPKHGNQPAPRDQASFRANPSGSQNLRRLQGRPLPQTASQQGAGSSSHGQRKPEGAQVLAAPDLRRRPPTENFHDGLYAALDLGTNNCRLLVAQPTRPGQFRVVDAFSRIVRLGEGLGGTGLLSDDAMDRAIEALKVCAAKLSSRNVTRMRLIATEACRSAGNGEHFLSRVRVETGLTLEVINRETEARLAVSGCASLIGRDARSAVLFDIGGGSSEIAVLQIDGQRSPRLANHITHWTSLPVGVVTLSERHGGRHVTPSIFEAMVNEVEEMLARFDAPAARELNGPDSGFHMIGTSGTVTTLAGVFLNLPRYDRRQVDGLWMSAAEVTAMQERLVAFDYAARAANPCIGPDRADLVLAGCAILEAIRRRFPADKMRVADRGLREGLLTEMMADDGVWRRHRPRSPYQRN